MSQILVLPINDMEVTAGYKNENYRRMWGWTHYGVDGVSGRGVALVYACGDGEVVAAGQDGARTTGPDARLGLVAVIRYRDVLCHDGTVCDLACRCYHLGNLKVKAGDRVSKDTAIGFYGGTGAFISGAHLHIEFDRNVNYPCFAPGVSEGGRIINRAGERRGDEMVDSTIGPAEIWYLDDNQSLRGNKNSRAWVAKDVVAPRVF